MYGAKDLLNKKGRISRTHLLGGATITYVPYYWRQMILI